MNGDEDGDGDGDGDEGGDSKQIFIYAIQDLTEFY